MSYAGPGDGWMEDGWMAGWLHVDYLTKAQNVNNGNNHVLNLTE
jgi:hypothetical protein